MKKRHIGMVLLVFSIIVVSISFETRSNNVLITYDINPQTSSLTELPYTITIDKNWSETIAMYDWCTGNGTKENPYIIQGISINSNFTGGCLTILDSAEFFIIRNCSFSYGAGKYQLNSYAGIYIEKAENGVIDNCTFRHNFHGIAILEAEKINISNCRIIGSHDDPETGWGKAIYIREAKEVRVSRSYTLNHYDGFCSWDSTEIYIDLNHIENNAFGHISDTGVYFNNVNDSAITNNDFFGCNSTTQASSGLSTSSFSDYPIVTENCYNISVIGNKFYNGNDNGDDDGDDPLLPDPSPSNQIIPYGYCYLLFMIVGIITLVLLKKRRVYIKNIT